MRILLRILALGLMVYAGLVLVVILMQRRLLFLAPKVSSADLSGFAKDQRMIPWLNPAGQRIGWQRPIRPGSAAGCVLITHGNAGTAVGRDYLADPLQDALPFDVFILEYPGYGDRPGDPSQTTLLSAASEAADLLAGRTNLFLVGESLGSGIASYLAGRLGDRVSGVLLIVPYDRMTAVAAAHYPWLPVGWMMRDRFPAVEWLSRYRGPVAFLIASEDSVIPSRLGRALHEGYAGPKRLWEIAGADHEDVLHQPPSWWREVADFWGVSRRTPDGGGPSWRAGSLTLPRPPRRLVAH